MTNAGIYLRISSDRAGDELGIDRQREDCEKLCEAHVWQVAEIYADNDVSAFSGCHRPGYARLLADIEAGRIGAVVVWHPDRLHRSPKELERFIDVVEAHKVKVATVQSGELDLSTASGRMTARIVGSVARHESEQKSERMKRQRDQAALAGKPHGGIRSFGYSQIGHELVPEEARLIRDAAKRVLAGESLASICERWNAKGITGTKGHPCTIQMLRQTLAAPKLAGLRVHRGGIIGPGDWPAILTRETHDRLVAVFQARSRPGRPPTSLLVGLIRCGVCGSNLQQSASRRDYRRYACHKAPGRPGCGGVTIRGDHTEELVVGAVLYRLDSKAFRKKLARPKKAPQRGEDPAALQADLEVLAAAAGGGEIPVREYLTARKPLEERLRIALASVEVDDDHSALAPMLGATGDLRDVWEKLELGRQRAVLAALIDEIRIAPAVQRARFDPARVDVVWRS